MKCGKCGSENVSVQAVSVIKRKHHGILYWLLFGWLWELMLWIFLTIPMLIYKLLAPKKYRSKLKTVAVCQNCGKQWAI